MLVQADLLFLAVALQVEEQLILCSECLMSFNMINKLLVAILAQSLKVDSIGGWLPLEVE